MTVLRVKLPPHCKHPPHTHPFAEVATVLGGRLGTALLITVWTLAALGIFQKIV